MPSAVQRLLDELSWEGNARKYRDGGLGLENVLTAEVFQALDFLPRRSFLGTVLLEATGAAEARSNAATEAEEAEVDILAGDLSLPDLGIKVQPDVVISSPRSYVFVEAKRVKRSYFPTEQVARELLVAAQHGAGRQPLLLLVLGKPPPLPVVGHGALSIASAVQLGLDSISARLGLELPALDPAASIAYITWNEIALHVQRVAASYPPTTDGGGQAVRRIAATLTEAVRLHS